MKVHSIEKRLGELEPQLTPAYPDPKTVLNSPIWDKVGDIILNVLADYPDLRTKIAEELIAMEESIKKEMKT